jgi:peptide/nickel transport system permease protein
LAAFLAFGLVGPLLYRTSPEAMEVSKMFAAPSVQHPFGVDNYGRDALARAMQGLRVSLLIGLLTALLTTVLGLVFGVVAGYWRHADAAVSRVVDAMMVFPDVLLAIALLAAMGGGLWNVILALSFVYGSRAARLVRGLVLAARGNAYVEAARAIGCPTRRVILRHILPNVASGVIVNASYCFAYAVLAEAGLSFLGLGVPPPAPSLGNMIAEGQKYMRTAPWLVLCPGALIAMLVLAVNMLGDNLRDVLDPFYRK